jgi:hypothetical protein
LLKENEKDHFSVFLVKVGHQLQKQEWKDMKNQYKIPEGTEINDAFEFFDWLRQKNIINPSNLEELKKLLTESGKIQILNEIVLPFEEGSFPIFFQKFYIF